MLTVWGSKPTACCDAIPRRDFVRAGVLGLSGLSLGQMLRARSQAAESGRTLRQRAVILYWLDGGPTHMETYDPKPEAPAEFRGPFGAIETAAPGILLNELLVEQAKVMDKVSLVRSVHHNNGDHFAAAHWMLTGYYGSNATQLDPKFPSAGSIIAKLHGPNRPGMPPYVSVPHAASVGLQPGYNSAAYLGVAYNPFNAGGDPNAENYRVPNLDLPDGLTMNRLEDRKSLLASVDLIRRNVDHTGLMDGLDSFNQQAFDMVSCSLSA